MKILFLEPFYGGSHRNFADGLISHSRHEIDLLAMPARFWKWRMRGAALYFSQKIKSPEDYDGILTSSLMSLSDLKALLGRSCPPLIVYFHENQLTYPLAPGESMDYHFGFTDVTTALAAKRIIFNSKTHCDAFFSTLPDFLGRMPEYRPKWVVEIIRAKAGVVYPGCQFSAEKDPEIDGLDARPLIIWNHRWEFDKNPEEFFCVLDSVMARGVDFQLALLGENFQTVPKEFIRARERYGKRIVHYGYVKSRDAYIEWLKRGSVVISTAIQENFGISIVEASRYGCIPLVPKRLSYPEIMPDKYHGYILYEDREDLVEKFTFILRNHERLGDVRRAVSRHMARYSWENLIKTYDHELENLCRQG